MKTVFIQNGSGKTIWHVERNECRETNVPDRQSVDPREKSVLCMMRRLVFPKEWFVAPDYFTSISGAGDWPQSSVLCRNTNWSQGSFHFSLKKFACVELHKIQYQSKTRGVPRWLISTDELNLDPGLRSTPLINISNLSPEKHPRNSQQRLERSVIYLISVLPLYCAGPLTQK